MKKAVYSLTLLWSINIICVVPLIDNFNYDFLKSKGVSEKDIFFRTLGEAKDLISALSYLKADEYYHGGMKHKDLEPHVCILHDRKASKGDHKHIHKKKTGVDKFSKFNVLPRLGRALGIHQLRHLQGEEEKEIIPWFYYSVKLNPHNIDSYTIGAYWVGERLGKVNEALDFLKEGMRHNPGAWQIYSSAGDLYFNGKQDYEQAIRFYSKAETLINDGNANNYDKSHLFTFLGVSYERIGKIDKALEYYRKNIELFPQHNGLKERIKKLELIKGKQLIKLNDDYTDFKNEHTD